MRRKDKRSLRVPSNKNSRETPPFVPSPVDDVLESTHQAGRAQRNPGSQELIEMFSKLKALGIPEESIVEVVVMATRPISEGMRVGIDVPRTLWPKAHEIVSSYIGNQRPEGEKYPFEIYSERITKFNLMPKEQRLAFYILCGFTNKQIGVIIGRSVHAVKKQVQSLRRKLGIEKVDQDDRVNTIRTLLGLK